MKVQSSHNTKTVVTGGTKWTEEKISQHLDPLIPHGTPKYGGVWVDIFFFIQLCYLNHVEHKKCSEMCFCWLEIEKLGHILVKNDKI
jgi:hypothetical protein